MENNIQPQDYSKINEKQELELKAQRYLYNIDEEIKSLGKSVKTTGTTTLLVGGIFLVAFLVGRKLLNKNKVKAFNDPVLNQNGMNQLVVTNTKKESPIVRMIKEHIAIFLMALIKQKLMLYLTETAKKNESLR